MIFPRNERRAPRASRGAIACGVALLALGAPRPALAIEVELANGKKFQPKRVTYDGQEFTFYSPAKLKIAADQVTSLDVDVSKIEKLEREKSDGERKLSESGRKLERLRQELGAVRRELSAEKKENSSLRERLRLREDAWAKANVEGLRGDLRKLGAAKKKAEARVRELEEEVKTLRLAQRRKQAKAPGKPVFEVLAADAAPSKIQGLADVRGRVRNSTAAAFKTAIFDVSVLGNSGKLLATATAFVSDFKAGSTRSFSTDLEVDASQVGRVEIVLAAAFPAD